MFNPDVLTFQEFMMQEPLPLATVQKAVLEFITGREDVVLFGAQAVNAYVAEPRMTQDIDLLSPHADEIADALRGHLSDRFHIAVRVRQAGKGLNYRLYQVRKSGNRHLVDVRQISKLPQIRQIAGVQVMAPADLIASKVIAYYQRQGRPKSGTDWRDVAMLLLTFPELKSDLGAVHDLLQAAGVESAIIDLWHDLAAQDIQPEDEDAGY